MYLVVFYSSVLPFDSALFVIDIFFFDGVKVLFQLALTILSENRDELLKCQDDGDAIMLLTSYLEKLDEHVDEIGHETKIVRLIKKSYMIYNGINEEDVNRLRLKHRLKVVQSMGESLLQSAAKNTLKYTKFTEQQIKDLFYAFKVARKRNILFDRA
jgi:TBC1 domain family member 8/9